MVQGLLKTAEKRARRTRQSRDTPWDKAGRARAEGLIVSIIRHDGRDRGTGPQGVEPSAYQ